jgi:hypothetical protein
MVFHFSVYHCGSIEALAAECDGTGPARAEAFRLLERSTRGASDDVARSRQARVVVSDDGGTNLFTLAFVAAENAPRHMRATH